MYITYNRLIKGGNSLGKFSDFDYKEEVKQKETLNKEYEDKIEKYSKLCRDELMQEFMKLTMSKKTKGELNDAELENIKNSLYPYLDLAQKSNLDSIINMIKKC